eukprot:snap_masked-scaffold_4-processed-gene-19.48-mRNA-1 protein AED:0.13 eAED:1.00 QI:0/0/0/1/1/1/3/0/323
MQTYQNSNLTPDGQDSGQGEIYSPAEDPFDDVLAVLSNNGSEHSLLRRQQSVSFDVDNRSILSKHNSAGSGGSESAYPNNEIIFSESSFKKVKRGSSEAFPSLSADLTSWAIKSELSYDKVYFEYCNLKKIGNDEVVKAFEELETLFSDDEFQPFLLNWYANLGFDIFLTKPKKFGWSARDKLLNSETLFLPDEASKKFDMTKPIGTQMMDLRKGKTVFLDETAIQMYKNNFAGSFIGARCSNARLTAIILPKIIRDLKEKGYAWSRSLESFPDGNTALILRKTYALESGLFLGQIQDVTDKFNSQKEHLFNTIGYFMNCKKS